MHYWRMKAGIVVVLLSAVAAEHLMVAVANHPGMVKLDLNESVDVGYVGLEMIGRYL
jgi:hypothetical protein